MKKVWALYGLCLMVFLAGCVAYSKFQPANWPNWLVVVPLVLFIWPVSHHLVRGFTILTVSGGKLRYQEGVLSRSTRTMELSRLQDVRVDQTLWQRIIGIGSVSLETAGESGRLMMESIDDPHGRADAILEAARACGPRTGTGTGTGV